MVFVTDLAFAAAGQDVEATLAKVEKRLADFFVNGAVNVEIHGVIDTLQDVGDDVKWRQLFVLGCAVRICDVANVSNVGWESEKDKGSGDGYQKNGQFLLSEALFACH